MNTKQTEALKLALETAEGIAGANWREWHELASPEEFERWVKSRATHMGVAIREALTEESSGTEQPKLSDYEPDGMHHNKPHKCNYPKCSYPCPDLPDCRDTEQPAQQQEPLFWYDEEEGWLHDNYDDAPSGCIPLYTSPQPAQQQEPVARFDRELNNVKWRDGLRNYDLADQQPLYTSSQPSKPLTDEMDRQAAQIEDYSQRNLFITGWLHAEAAHGIKGDA